MWRGWEDGLQQSISAAPSTEPEKTSVFPVPSHVEPWWPTGWWRIMDTRIGIIPVPIYVMLFALIVGFVYTGGIMDVSTIAAAGLAAITLYLMGVMCHRSFGLPAPVAMLFLAVLAKLTSAVSPHLQQGGFVVYKFFSTAVTYPLLFAIGVSLTPWDKLVAAFNVPNMITIFSTVVTLMATGAVVGRLLNMYPIESAIINACHSGQGGTGDVAILTAANRMQLMPFAQIATRIGGAITVTIVLIILSRVT